MQSFFDKARALLRGYGRLAAVVALFAGILLLVFLLSWITPLSFGHASLIVGLLTLVAAIGYVVWQVNADKKANRARARRYNTVAEEANRIAGSSTPAATSQPPAMPHPSNSPSADMTQVLPPVEARSVTVAQTHDRPVRYLEPEEFVQPSWPLYAAGISLVIVTVVTQSLVGLLAHIGPIGAHALVIRLVVLVLTSAFVYWYLRMVRKQLIRDHPEEEKLKVGLSTRLYREGQDSPQFPLIRMSDKEVRKVMNYVTLNPEDPRKADQIIYVLTRRHIALQVIGDVFITVVWLVITGFLVFLVTKGMSGTLATTLSLLIGFIIVGFVINQWLSWWSWRFMVTDKRSVLIIKWPAWLFWKEGLILPVAHVELRSCKSQDQSPWLSKQFKEDYGILDVDGSSDDDDLLRYMKKIPAHRIIAQIIRGLRPQFAYPSTQDI